MDWMILLLLGIWSIVTGILSVTNVRVEWASTIAGFAALILGLVCLIRVFSSFRKT